MIFGTSSTTVCLKKIIKCQTNISERTVNFFVIRCIKVMDCIQEFGKHANFMQLLFYHEQEENHEIMRPRPNKKFLYFSEKSDNDLQDGIFQSNTRTDVNLELLTDDNKKTSKQSTIAQKLKITKKLPLTRKMYWTLQQLIMTILMILIFRQK